MNPKLRVGLLDFDADVRFGRRLILESNKSLEVVHESNGVPADLELISEGLFDILIIDQRLTAYSGLDFYRELCLLTGIRQAPSAILTTPFEQPALTLDAIEQGFSEVVSTELGAEALVEAAIRAGQSQSQFSLATIHELLGAVKPAFALDLELMKIVASLPERLASNLRRLRQVIKKADLEKLKSFDQESLANLVERFPVRNLAQLVVKLHRSELLDVE
jgi:DNA-binding NarL/FixJ family response regulator